MKTQQVKVKGVRPGIHYQASQQQHQNSNNSAGMNWTVLYWLSAWGYNLFLWLNSVVLVCFLLRTKCGFSLVVSWVFWVRSQSLLWLDSLMWVCFLFQTNVDCSLLVTVKTLCRYVFGDAKRCVYQIYNNQFNFSMLIYHRMVLLIWAFSHLSGAVSSNRLYRCSLCLNIT